jgi:hypothetical protein
VRVFIAVHWKTGQTVEVFTGEDDSCIPHEYYDHTFMPPPHGKEGRYTGCILFYYWPERQRLEFVPPCGPALCWECCVGRGESPDTVVTPDRWAVFDAWAKRTF